MYFPKGIITSMVTSFNENLEVDYQGIIKNIAFQKSNGINKLCFLGGTGEATSLSKSERHKTMEVVMQNTDDMEVIFGALVGNINDIKVDIEKAKSLGATACMIMPPPFIMPSDKDVIRFVEELSSIGLPLIIFNSPGRLGYDLPVSVILELSKIKNVVGIKESTSSIMKLQDLIHKNQSNDFSILVGGDVIYFPAITLGASGGLLALPAVIPELFSKMEQCIYQKDYKNAQEYHYFIKELDDLIYQESHPVPLKTAMETKDLLNSHCRLPFKNIDSNLKSKISTTMEKLNSIK